MQVWVETFYDLLLKPKMTITFELDLAVWGTVEVALSQNHCERKKPLLHIGNGELVLLLVGLSPWYQVTAW